MKKILYGILMIFLVALAANNVSAAVTWDDNAWDTAYPSGIVYDENTPDPTIDLSTYRTGTPTGNVIYSFDDDTLDTNKITIDVNDSTGVATFSLEEYQFGDLGLVDFTVTDDNGTDELTASVIISGINDASWKTTVPLTILFDEDGPYTDLDLKEYVIKPSSIPDTALRFDDTGFSSDIVSVEISGSQVIFTPKTDQYRYGTAGSITFTVDDGAGIPATFTANVIIEEVNDKPVLSTITDYKYYKVQEDVKITSLEFDPAKDVDDVASAITYTLEFDGEQLDSTFTLPNLKYDSSKQKVVIDGTWEWEPTKSDVGKLKLKLIAEDNGGGETEQKLDEQPFVVNVYSKCMCKYGKIGTYLDVTIDDPEEDKEFGPGDEIDVKVTVDVTGSDDRKVIVKAVLYDLDSKKTIADVTSDYEKIKVEDGYETFYLTLPIPLVTDDEYGGDYVLYVKSYEKGEEDIQCIADMVGIDISREDHKVIIQSLTMTPSIVKPGDEIDALVRVLNIGEKKEAGVFVVLKNEDLEISLTSSARDLGTYDESGNFYTFKFKDIKIPEDAEAETYDFEAYVVFGGPSTLWMDSPSYKIGDAKVSVEEFADGITTDTPDDTTTPIEDESEFPWSTVLWIIGDIVLIVVAIFFIKLIFSARKRRPKVKEVKL